MFIVVLNDGETYTSIHGCKVVWVADEATPEQIEESLKDLHKADLKGDAEIVTTFK